MSSNIRIISLFCLWLCCVGAVFWWFQFKWLSSLPTEGFSSYAATFQVGNIAENTKARSASDTITIVHFVDPLCPCTKFSLPHISDLELALGDKVRHLRLTPEDDKGELAYLLKKLPASPAVAIWGPLGSLRYFGPYSSGAVCGQGQDRVKNIVAALYQGDDFRWLNQDALGCFCPWPSPTSNTVVYATKTEQNTGTL